MDEERRLFYVAVTRAKDHLYLFSPTMRKMADGGMFPVERSVFVKEIPSELVIAKRVTGFPDAYSGYGAYGGYAPRNNGFRSRTATFTRTSWRR